MLITLDCMWGICQHVARPVKCSMMLDASATCRHHAAHAVLAFHQKIQLPFALNDEVAPPPLWCRGEAAERQGG